MACGSLRLANAQFRAAPYQALRWAAAIVPVAVSTNPKRR